MFPNYVQKRRPLVLRYVRAVMRPDPWSAQQGKVRRAPESPAEKGAVRKRGRYRSYSRGDVIELFPEYQTSAAEHHCVNKNVG